MYLGGGGGGGVFHDYIVSFIGSVIFFTFIKVIVGGPPQGYCVGGPPQGYCDGGPPHMMVVLHRWSSTGLL